MRFAKMHGLGNDFVIVNGFTEKLPDDLGAFAKQVCHRQLGIGADGLIAVGPAAGGEVAMTYYNSDGGEATMCGNGARCAVAFARRLGLARQECVLRTAAGPVRGA